MKYIKNILFFIGKGCYDNCLIYYIFNYFLVVKKMFGGIIYIRLDKNGF